MLSAARVSWAAGLCLAGLRRGWRTGVMSAATVRAEELRARLCT